MRLITSIHAYDCLSTVVYAVRVHVYEDYERADSYVGFDLQGQFPGVGEDDPERWLRMLLDELRKSL